MTTYRAQFGPLAEVTAEYLRRQLAQQGIQHGVKVDTEAIVLDRDAYAVCRTFHDDDDGVIDDQGRMWIGGTDTLVTPDVDGLRGQVYELLHNLRDQDDRHAIILYLDHAGDPAARLVNLEDAEATAEPFSPHATGAPSYPLDHDR